jgi:23S rRNA pseudouridine1911/1915/1917 synthase
MDEYSITVEKEDQGKRIDKYLAEKFEDLSRSFIQKLIREAKIKVNNSEIDKSYKISSGDFLKIQVEAKESEIKAVEMELDIN